MPGVVDSPEAESSRKRARRAAGHDGDDNGYVVEVRNTYGNQRPALVGQSTRDRRVALHRSVCNG